MFLHGRTCSYLFLTDEKTDRFLAVRVNQALPEFDVAFVLTKIGHGRQVVVFVDDLGPILQNSISAVNFSDKFSISNLYTHQLKKTIQSSEYWHLRQSRKFIITN
jgi:hypothetical protein